MRIIQNVRVMDPASGRDEITDLLIEGDRISAIRKARDEEIQKAWSKENGLIDGRGLCAGPGLVDIHVHFRDPGQTYKEDIHTGSAAAAAGGVTSLVCMANTKPPVDSLETLKDLLDREKNLSVHVYQTATVTKGLKGQELTDMKALAAAGAVGFTDDGIPIRDEKLLLSAFRQAEELDLPVSLHEEDPDLIGSAGVNQGKVSEQLGLPGAPALAEQTLTARDCLLARESGVKLDIQHVSSGITVDLLRFMKKEGVNVRAEVTPTHFSFTEDLVLEKGTLAKVNPPLRTEWDRQKLIEGLKDGTLDMIVTDHAPHTLEEKAKGFDPKNPAPSGLIGLETSLALGITKLVQTGDLSLMELLRKMTVNPADFYKLPAGRLSEGGPADIVLFDPEEKWTLKEEDLHSKSKNSPFIGMEFTGRVKMTICRGQVVYTNNR
jgi:dihydroorotase